MTTKIHEEWMARAIDLSRKGYPLPNPHVGCVIVNNGEIVGEGYHDHAAGPHAEVGALAQAGASAKGATAYVTLDPCNHFGKTPPCSEALIAAGIACVVIATDDPNPKASGGVARLCEAGIEVVHGVLAQEASAANRIWRTAMELERPFVRLKAAITLDGFLARKDGSSKWITSEASRDCAKRMRGELGAVLVGRRTIELDNPQLLAPFEEIVNPPLRVVIDPQRLIGEQYQVFQDGHPTVRLVSESFAQAGDIPVPSKMGRLDLHAALKLLFDRGVRGLFVEGGAQTLGNFLQERLFDELVLFQAPVCFGEGVSWSGSANVSLADFQFQSLAKIGPDVLITLGKSEESADHR